MIALSFLKAQAVVPVQDVGSQALLSKEIGTTAKMLIESGKASALLQESLKELKNGNEMLQIVNASFKNVLAIQSIFKEQFKLLEKATTLIKQLDKAELKQKGIELLKKLVYEIVKDNQNNIAFLRSLFSPAYKMNDAERIKLALQIAKDTFSKSAQLDEFRSRLKVAERVLDTYIYYKKHE